MNTEVFSEGAESNMTRIISGTDRDELFQSLDDLLRLVTQGVALGWDLQTPAALEPWQLTGTIPETASANSPASADRYKRCRSHPDDLPGSSGGKIGRASCRERV